MQLWNNISLIKENVAETPAMKAIRTGLNIDDNFWNNFILICNNPEALSELLDVNMEKVASWGNKVKHNLDLVKNNKENNKQLTKVIDTGDI